MPVLCQLHQTEVVVVLEEVLGGAALTHGVRFTCEVSRV